MGGGRGRFHWLEAAVNNGNLNSLLTNQEWEVLILSRRERFHDLLAEQLHLYCQL